MKAWQPLPLFRATFNALRTLQCALPRFLRRSRKMKVLLVIVALMVAQTTAHLCLLFPHQRGTAQGLNMAGRDLSCGRCTRLKTVNLVQGFLRDRVEVVIEIHYPDFNRRHAGVMKRLVS